MAAGVELAVGYVTLTAETKTLARDVSRAFSGVESQAGRTGQAMGRAMTQSFNNSAPDINGLRREVWTAHQRITASAEQSAKKQEAASRKVAIAQAKVNETVAKYGADSSQALTAVDRLSTAQQRLEAETLSAASAQQRLERELRDAQAAVTQAAAASETSARTYADGWRGVGQRIGGYLSRGVRDASDEAEGEAEQGGQRSSSVFATAFKAGLGVLAAKFSVDAVVGGIKQAIGGAGDIEQSIGAVESVFKGAAGEMLNFSRTASTAVGLSSNSYNELATVLGAQLKNAGVSLDEIGSKTNGLITTGADLSSMFGGTAADAVGALSSALKGEMDPIEKYGITLNEAALKAQAMSMGLLKPIKDAGKIEVATGKMELAQRKYNDAVAKSGKDSDQALAAKNTLTAAQNAFDTATTGSLPALDSQTKAIAVMAAIEKQSADAKGNFAKEEDTFSHKQQVAAAQWEDLSTKIGGIFLPAATAAFGFIGDKALPILDEIIGGLKAFGAAFTSADDDITSTGFAGEMEKFGHIVRDNIGWITALGAGVIAYAGAMKTMLIINAVKRALDGMTVAQWALNVAMRANPIGIVVGILAALVVGVIVAYNKIGWFKDFVDGSLKAIGDLFSWLYENAIKPAFDGIMVVVGAVVGWFKSTAVPYIQAAVAIAGAVFGWLWSSVVKPVFGFIQSYIGVVFTIVRAVFQLVVAVVRNVLAPVFVWLWKNVVQPTFKAIGDFIGWVWRSIITPVFNALKWYISNVLAPVFTWLWKTIIKPAFDGISSAIKWSWEHGIRPVFDFLKKAITETVPNAFQKGIDGIKHIWNKLLDIAKSPVRFVVNTVINDGLIGAFNKVAGILPGIDKLPRVALPNGFRDGGYTGRFGRDQIAGFVHGDEHVIRSESRRSIESAAPGLLESFNQMGARALGVLGFRNGGRVNPTKNMSLTQGYSAFHDGIDIGVGIGTPVFAAGDGVVTLAGQGASAPGVSGGTEVHVRGDGIEQWYAHLSQVGVQVGQQVSAGQQIALSGNTGISSGPHLHFGTYAGGWPNAMNPLSYLAGASAPEGGSSGGGWMDPFGALVKLSDGVLKKVRDAIPGGGFMVDAAAGIGKKLITDVIGWGKSKLGMGGVTGSPTLFDGGGWLTNTGGPQLVDHQRSRPDAVLTNQQWRDVSTLAADNGERGRLPERVALVVDGHEFSAYVDRRAGSVIKSTDNSGRYTRVGGR